MEETLFEVERQQSRTAIADYLQSVVDKLAADESFTLTDGAEEITLTVPETAEFEVKVERETEGDDVEMSVEFEIEWSDGETGGAFQIE
ncbi:amphi-Trp domain-containing protein [Halocatena halophila]|uniref:amphi-Trp domain-containing protein n=1 Tax=Halocatena halophila TaxID=2814576 RepID=UPI002ED6BD8B